MNLYKKKIIIILLFYFFIINSNFYYNNFKLNNFYKNSLNKQIKIGLVAGSVKNGGAERSASLICYYFNKVKIFKLFLFTFKKKEKNEFYINGNIERIIIKHNLIEVIKQKQIDILLYQTYNYRQIEELNKII